MRKDRAFWDSSSLLLLCCDQKGFTAVSQNLVRQFPKIVVWWSTPVEMENGLCRLIRKGEIDREQSLAGKRRLSLLLSRWREVLPTEQLRLLAVDIVQRHALTTADALQLAAALIWCNQKPHNRPFVCFDKNLNAAATEVGFLVFPYP